MSSAAHKKLYKSLRLTASELRRARTSLIKELRKRSRANEHLRRRNMSNNVNSEVPTNDLEEPEPTTSTVEEQPQQLVVPEGLRQELDSNEEQTLLQAIIEFRVSISRLDHNTAVGLLTYNNLVERFVVVLNNSSNSITQYEVVAMLHKLVVGTSHKIELLIEAGAMPAFMALLSRSCQKVQEEIMWVLGNIADNSSRNRDILCNLGILEPMLYILRFSRKASLLRSAIWTFANLSHWRNPPFNYVQIAQSMYTLHRLLEHWDHDILRDTCLTICFLSNAREHVQLVLDAGICHHLVRLLAHIEREVFLAALKAVGNIVHGNEQQIQAVLDHNAMPYIRLLMGYSSELIRKQACRSIANIAAGSPDQIQAIIDANIFPQMLQIIKTSKSKTSKEIIRSLTNATTHGRSDQIHYLVSINSLPTICDYLTSTDPAVTLMALKTLDNVLRVDNDYQTLPNPYAKVIEECGGLSKIEYLQSHENIEIYHKSYNMIDEFFEEDDDVRMTPVTGTGINQFEFNTQNLPHGTFHF